jgi:hypothetical protein
MPAIRAWMAAHQEPANASQIARGAGVHRSSVRTFLDYLEPGELELTGLPGSPKYRLRHPDSFERMLAAEAVAEAARMPLDEALAGIHRIATAAGIFEDTWQARNMAEVCDIIAAWCAARRPGVTEEQRPRTGADAARRTLTAQLARHRASCQTCRDRADAAGRNRRGCQDADRIIGQLQRLAADGR